MDKLSASVMRLTFEATEPIRLGAYPGSALRGALLQALLQRFCRNPGAMSCYSCALNAGCPIAGLVAPFREEHPRGKDLPRPFILATAQPLHAEKKASTQPDEPALEPGDLLTFDLTLFGTASKHFSSVMTSLPLVESDGIGGRMRDLGGRRGRVRVQRVEAVTVGGCVMESLYDRSQRRISVPSTTITAEVVENEAEKLSTERLTLEFLTPTRLIADGHLLKLPAFRPLILRLAQRLEDLERAYAETASPDSEATQTMYFQRYMTFDALARGVRMDSERITWIDLSSFSSRQRRMTPIGGFIGQATYAGDLSALRKLLVWGEICHVGKDAVKGNGCYRILREASC